MSPWADESTYLVEVVEHEADVWVGDLLGGAFVAHQPTTG